MPGWVRVLGVRPSAGVSQRAILIQLYKNVLPLSLYMPGLKAWTHHGTDEYNIYTGTNPIDEFDVVAMTSPPGKNCWWGSACALEASQLQSASKLPGLRPVWIRHFNQFTILRLRTQHPVVVSPQISGSSAPLCGWTNHGLPEVVPTRGSLSIRSISSSK